MGYERDQVFVYSLCMEMWYVCEDKKEEFHWKVYLVELQMYAAVEVLHVIKLLLEINDQQQIVFMLQKRDKPKIKMKKERQIQVS